jgi:hypothetical protein
LNTLPYKKMPQLILIELIYHVVLWLNAFPSKSGISETLLPRKIILCHHLDFAKHCRAPFGSSCEVHDEPAPTNSMMLAIVLGPMGNLQGTYKFFSLIMGAKIRLCQFTCYPMPDSVIAKVEQFALAGAAPGALDFANRSSILFEWNEEMDESPGNLVEEDYAPYPLLTAEFPGVDLRRNKILPTVEDNIEPHGRPKDAAALNAGILLLDVAGVERGEIIDAHAAEFGNDRAIVIEDLPPPPARNAAPVDNNNSNAETEEDSNVETTSDNIWGRQQQ